MTTTYNAPGETEEFTAPSGGVTSGIGYKVGRAFVVAAQTALVGIKFTGIVTGKHLLPKVAAEPWTEGMLVYYNTASALATSVSTTAMLIGWASRVEANPTSLGLVRLNGVGGVRLNGEA